MLRILIADDHELIRRGLSTLLGSRSDWEICGEARDGRDAVEQATKLSPDVVLLDISMPHCNGLEAARRIRNAVPQARILVLSQHETSNLLETVLEAGAQGYVCKSNLARDLLGAIEGLR
jgi:DNA-binding NarL/FixJ family response regulator